MFCSSEILSLWGQCSLTPRVPSGCSQGGWNAERSVSLILRLRWGVSLCVPSMGEVGAQSGSVCRIFPSDSWCIRPSFPPRDDLGEEEEEKFLLWRAPFLAEELVYGRFCWFHGVKWSVPGSWALCALNDRGNAIQFWTELLNGNGTCWAAKSLHCHSHRVRLGLWSSVCVVLYPINLHKNAWSSLGVMVPSSDAAQEQCCSSSSPSPCSASHRRAVPISYPLSCRCSCAVLSKTRLPLNRGKSRGRGKKREKVLPTKWK